MNCKKAYRVLSLPRSGHHAIINWIAGERLESIGISRFASLSGSKLLATSGLDRDAGYVYDTYTDLHNHVKKNARKDIDFFCLSKESMAITEFELIQLPKFISRVESLHNVIIMRDLFNWYASCFKAQHSIYNHTLGPNFIRLGRKVLDDLGDYLFINYNKWCHDKTYRKDISNKLGFKSNDALLRVMSYQGDGSSFTDGKVYNLDPSKMPLMRRWETFKDEKKYWAFFTEEMIEINREIFGDEFNVKIPTFH